MYYIDVCLPNKVTSELAEVSKRLREKEQEMKTMEQKYKQYLEKAKIVRFTVICMINPWLI